ncbi:MAG: pyridoxamine 5'-phosphate oxidase family protein [Candidatus Kaelpia aquatica]|nr:pyridoxamine 5'-phosphate oxidase family protein [Candidatus Kaelpia aquatica]
MELSDKVINFFKKQSFVIVSTIDLDGRIHCSAKGIAGIHKNGHVFVVDLYHNKTYGNLNNDPRVSITQVDEHSFTGYTLTGQAKIVLKDDISDDYIKEWEKRVLKRMSDRLIKSVQSEKVSSAHYEAQLPEEPKYLIEIDVESVIDLAPPYRSREER